MLQKFVAANPRFFARMAPKLNGPPTQLFRPESQSSAVNRDSGMTYTPPPNVQMHHARGTIKLNVILRHALIYCPQRSCTE